MSSEDDVEYHEFSHQELNKMLYHWDDSTAPVQEYHYMKPEWRQNHEENEPLPTETNLRKHAYDDGQRTIVDLKKEAPDNHALVYLDLDTELSAFVVEFYAPWCPHCRVFKPRYVELAQEVTRRAIGTPVSFYAVSCELYPVICRTYEIDGYPAVFGYAIGDIIEERGSVLNEHGVPMTAESIAESLELTLAHEQKVVTRREFADSEEEEAYRMENQALAKSAAQEKKMWHEYRSTLNERYHNAAASLAFVLRTGVFLSQDSQLDGRRVIALRDFLELVDWASPEQWYIRMGLVRDLLERMDDISSSPELLTEVVEHHQSAPVLEDGLWGDVEVSSRRRIPVYGLEGGIGKEETSEDVEEALWRNSQWTEACTHSQRGMGYTCGLWDLFHILTIGASRQKNQLRGFHSGYLTDPHHVAEVIKRFIANFLACDVCRWNFVDMFENCGHNRCQRLASVMPSLVSSGTEERELALWLFEVHNSVNVRLMKESAELSDREVTEEEQVSAVFPTKEMCSACWLNDTMERYDRDSVFAFLEDWYWPAHTTSNAPFQRIVQRRAQKISHSGITSIALFPVAIVASLCARRMTVKTVRKSRSKLI